MSDSTKRQIKAFLFDLDGTLVDSNEAHAKAWADAFSAEKISFNYSHVRGSIGMGSDHLLKLIANIEVASDEGKRLVAKRDDIFKSQYLSKIRAIDGASELLRELRERGFRLVLASSGNAKDISAILKSCGLDSYFDATVNSNEVDNSKPNPDVLKVALEKAEADADEAIMVGDTPYDLKAAQTLGVAMIALTCGGSGPAELEGAAKILDGPRDLSTHLDSILFELHGSTSSKTARTANLTEAEESEVEDHVSQRTPVIFEIIRREGNEELRRPLLSLWSSGLTAGLSMGLSLLAQGFLKQALPKAPWADLISKLGYSAGFLVVILAHQQLFTENTLTAVVPLLAEFSKRKLRRVVRLWSSVLGANIIGTFLFSAFALCSGAFSENLRRILLELSLESMAHTWQEFVSRGLVAGFIIASLVWILANITYSKFAVIVFMTYLVALMDLSHIVAGSVEAEFALLSHAIAWSDFGLFFISTLAGNILGGSALFAILSYAQIHAEISTSD